MCGGNGGCGDGESKRILKNNFQKKKEKAFSVSYNMCFC